MWLKILLFLIVYISIDIVNGVAWPQCGEFVFPKDDTNLSIEEKQFRRKLPTLFDSYDCGNAFDVEKTLKSLEKFKNLTSEKKCLETQTLSPSLEIVSLLIILYIFVVCSDFLLSIGLLILHRRSVFKAMDILQQHTKW